MSYFTLIYQISPTQAWRMCSHFMGMLVCKQPLFQINYEQYVCTKDKPMKSTKMEWIMICLKYNNQQFMYVREKHKNDGAYIIAGSLSFSNNKLFDCKQLKRKKDLYIETYIWESFIIQFIPLQNSHTIVIIQQTNSSTSLLVDNLEHEINYKLEAIFLPLLEFFFDREIAMKIISENSNFIIEHLKTHSQLFLRIDENKIKIFFQLLKLGYICKNINNYFGLI